MSTAASSWRNRTIGFLATLTLLTGCATMGLVTPESPMKDVERARALFEEGRDRDALELCIELNRRDPLMPGLAELQADIMTRLNEQRIAAAITRDSTSTRRAIADVFERELVPDTYGMTRGIRGDKSSLRTDPTAMRRKLEQRIDMSISNVTLEGFIGYLHQNYGVNIVADLELTEALITVEAKDVPISEILDYAARNMGVAFYVGDNIIWVTQASGESPGTPMQTRMYRLRKGLSASELKEGEEQVRILDAVERFIPVVEGADLMFDRKSHLLIVRNTLHNLDAIENLIEAMDISPPQVMIEARFISTEITDLQELGINWLLDSPHIISEERASPGGRMATRTRIDSGASIGFGQFPHQAVGINFTYRGILTEPMFRAVVHALELSGQSRTLSVPRVTTVNNMPARIRIGEDFRYFEEYSVVEVRDGRDDRGNPTFTSRQVPSGRPTLAELGIELRVTPSVGADMASITLDMVPEISEFVRWEYWDVAAPPNQRRLPDGTIVTNGGQIASIKLPVFRRSTIETEVIVRSGDTIVMGGLITSARTMTEKKVPILSEIPLIGRLFRHDIWDDAKQNLLIFVTATILSEQGETLVPLSEPAPESPPPPIPPPTPSPPT